MPVEPREFRDAMGRFATGITIVTTRDPDGNAVGFTANSFNSVSLEPPLVLFSLARRAHSWDAFVNTQSFAVNVLREEQVELSNRFARSGAENKFEGLAVETWETGAPILPEALASFECVLRHRYEGGDHLIFVGEVLRTRFGEGSPLLYFGGQYRALR